MRHPFLRTLAGTTTDPNFENVTLLLHGDGTNGGQNNTFVDGSTNNFTITRNGNTTQGTFSPYGDNWSNFFDGTDDYLYIADNANLRAGAGTFTIEAWIYRNATGAAHTIYAKGGASTGIVLQVTSTNVLRFTHTTTNIDSTGTIALATWTHVAVVREGTGTNETKLYINGTQDGAGTVSTDFTQTEEVRIGTDRSTAADFNGYISNLRFVKGTAVYTGAFTVPTAPLTAISNTQLLTCQSNRFRDGSTNNFTITRNGDVSVQRFSPFSPTAAYAAGTIGGSGYFDGTDDYVASPSNLAFAFGTADWTMEFWAYPTSTQSNMRLIQFGGDSDNLDTNFNGTGRINYYNGTASTTSANAVVNLYAWNHIALVRLSGTVTVYVNGASALTQATTPNSTTARICYIGGLGNGKYAGYISNFRIVKGTAVYTAAFTPPTAPLTAITNTSLLLNFTNAAILDNAMMAVPETVGNAQISTSVKKYGTGSLYFDGTGDYLAIPVTPIFNYGTENFTIELWFYAQVVSSSEIAIYRQHNSAGPFKAVDIRISSSKIVGVVVANATNIITGTTTLSTNTWYHVAFVRSGNVFTLYLNGTSEGTATDSGALDLPTTVRVAANQVNALFFTGYIDDLRITKGVARYTANFTPPTAAFPDL